MYENTKHQRLQTLVDHKTINGITILGGHIDRNSQKCIAVLRCHCMKVFTIEYNKVHSLKSCGNCVSHHTLIMESMIGHYHKPFTVVAIDSKTMNHVIVKCDCGDTKSIHYTSVKKNHGCSKQCKYSRDYVSFLVKTHGESVDRSLEYSSWNAMLQRCENPNNPAYSRYGGRGIKVCARWHTYQLFLADMGRRQDMNYVLDRIDNDGNYEPDNCQWISRSENVVKYIRERSPEETKRVTKLMSIGRKAAWDKKKHIKSNMTQCS